jgi:hypothetical protein
MKCYPLLIFVLLFSCTRQPTPIYSVPDSPWEESLGNHRAVITVDQPAEVAALDITWRRHDKNPEQRRFLIIHAETGDTIKNIYRQQVDNEKCRLLFGPAENSGTYYFYYLPYEVQTDWGFYNRGYLALEPPPSEKWMMNNKPGSNEEKNLPKAELTGFQSRTAFDSFFPMEVIALNSEKDSFLNEHPDDFLLFPEDRKFPIRMLDDIPHRWIQEGPSDEFKGKAQRNEYYAFQLGVYASQKDLQDVKVTFSALKNGDSEIPASSLTCFNTGGTDPYGKPFIKRVDVPEGAVQPLWIGVDIAENTRPGTYRGQVTITPENAAAQTIEVRIKVENKVLADRGDDEPWRHSRLRWLNSTLGIDDEPTHPYKAIENTGDGSYNMTGKIFSLHESGLPGGIRAGDTEILAGPVALMVETASGREVFSGPGDVVTLKDKPGIKSASWKSRSQNLELSGTGTIESDGYINYKITLKAPAGLAIRDVRLEIPLHADVAQYMMGMGLPGTTVPKGHEAPWKGPHDSFWIGNTRGGLWCELRGGEYHGPLLNLYQPAHPASWYNNNKGGFRIERDARTIKAVVYSGERSLKAGEELTFEWSMLITPVKDVNYKSQFTDRYFHNGLHPMPVDEDLASGVKIVNLHHASNYNPHINYPFVAVDSMKWFVDKMHEKGQKVKIYYTIRELTNYTTELWALRSLGDEILGTGKGGGYSWLREHLIDGYRPQWYQHFTDKSADASIVNAPGDSRWYNYYIEGLAWLIKNVGIDGLYLDDVSYDRRTVKRIRKVLDNTKPGCLLDLHSNTGFSKGPATQYAEYFPFMDKLWFGESFMYDEMPPENWLVEVSGIPFGLMGDMLHRGGNRWLGMLFGMTVRHPWMTDGIICDPRPIWKIWDEFQIQDSRMIGFWEDSLAATTDDADVKVTAYVKRDSTLLSIGNFSDSPKTVSLNINFKKLGLDKENVRLYAPAIQDFQQENSWSYGDKISINGRNGWIIYVFNEQCVHIILQ